MWATNEPNALKMNMLYCHITSSELFSKETKKNLSEFLFLLSRPFSGKQLEDAQKRAKHVIRLRYFLQDLGAYIVYLAFMSIVIHVYRDQDGYLVSKAVENSVNLTKFRSVGVINFQFIRVKNTLSIAYFHYARSSATSFCAVRCCAMFVMFYHVLCVRKSRWLQNSI